MNKGRFIVIEGADAAGKHTQTKLLHERAKHEGYRVAASAFPQYETPIGKEIHEYLHGKYGNLEKVDTKFASLLYMIDRHEAQPWINRTLNRVDLLISNRYSAANIAHQSAKEAGRKRIELMKWLYAFEHIKPFNHIEPNHTIYLDLPPSFARQAMIRQGRKLDIHEKDMKYREAVRRVFLMFAGWNENDKLENALVPRGWDRGWTVINCLKDKKTRCTEEEIAELIWHTVQPNISKNRLQIYFAASICGDNADRSTLQRIGLVLQQYGDIITPHVMSEEVKKEERARRAKGTNILERDRNLLEHANIVVGEVTPKGSYGIGREIEYALQTLGIPVLLLFDIKNRNYDDISATLSDDAKITLVPYHMPTLETVVGSTLEKMTASLY